jgi:L-iditol 2-dehydrogenase
MKAAVLYGVQRIEVEEVEEPEMSEGGLIIEVSTCAICGTDVKMHRYGYAAVELPFIPGHELAGTVVQSNAEDHGYRVGDRVTVNPNIPCGTCYYCTRGLQTACDNLSIIGVHRNGGFAQFVAVPGASVKQGGVFLIPDGVSFEEASLIDPASCAVNAAELSSVGPGSVVVVIGAGPAGCFNTEVCRARGASKIILMQRSPSRLEQARFTNADVFVNTGEEDGVERVLEETEGRGADAVIVACASTEAQEQSVKMVAKRGNINLFGGLPKGSPSIQFESNLIHYKESFVTGTHGGSNRHCRIALDMISSGRIHAKQYISFSFSLEEFHKALKKAEQREGLKAIVRPS